MHNIYVALSIEQNRCHTATECTDDVGGKSIAAVPAFARINAAGFADAKIVVKGQTFVREGDKLVIISEEEK